VPTVAVVSGPSYAGHASLAASCDIIITTPGSSIGMGGPPMVEAAFGLKLKHTELAPVEMHDVIGGIDLLVPDETTAITAARTFLSYNLDRPSGEPTATAADIRSLVPDTGPYTMHPVIEALVDRDSFFELRPHFATSLITGLARMDGRAVGIIASEPDSPLGGAIDQNAANKLARFVQLCDVYAMPIISLVDTPGFVVSVTEDEPARPGITRHHARPIRALHHRSVPLFCVQVGKARGLGAAAMAGIGRAHSIPVLRLGWPTAELGSHDPYWQGLDDVIDPAETRDRILRVLRLTPRPAPAERARRVRDVW
jgi:acetyl-CoA carboxylase carboxyltransferase component